MTEIKKAVDDSRIKEQRRLGEVKYRSEPARGTRA